MRKYSEEELELINIQIGCIFRLERLKRGMSQHDVSLDINSDPTTVGRIERFEHGIRWEKIYKLSQLFNLNFSDLFYLQKYDNILEIIKNCLQLDTKLTKKKEEYYKELAHDVKERFNNLKGEIKY